MKKINTGRLLLTVFLSLLLLSCVIPFVLMILGSFKDNYEIITLKPKFLPSHGFDLRKYGALFEEWPFVRNMLNSFIVTGITTVGACFFCGLIGFTFAKYEFPGKNVLYMILLSSMMIPVAARLVPSYLVIRALGGVNRYWALILPNLIPAFGVFLIRQYAASGIPDEMMEAARIEGAREGQIAMRIAFPIMTPVITSLAILTFMNSWNDFLWPLVVALKKEMFTVTVALRSLSDTSLQADYGIILAAATLSAIPILTLYVFAHKRLIEGMLEGSIKS